MNLKYFGPVNPRNLGNYEFFLNEIRLTYGSEIEEITRDELVHGNLRTFGSEQDWSIDEFHALENAMGRAEFNPKKTGAYQAMHASFKS